MPITEKSCLLTPTSKTSLAQAHLSCNRAQEGKPSTDGQRSTGSLNKEISGP